MIHAATQSPHKSGKIDPAGPTHSAAGPGWGFANLLSQTLQLTLNFEPLSSGPAAPHAQTPPPERTEAPAPRKDRAPTAEPGEVPQTNAQDEPREVSDADEAQTKPDEPAPTPQAAAEPAPASAPAPDAAHETAPAPEAHPEALAEVKPTPQVIQAPQDAAATQPKAAPAAEVEIKPLPTDPLRLIARPAAEPASTVEAPGVRAPEIPRNPITFGGVPKTFKPARPAEPGSAPQASADAPKLAASPTDPAAHQPSPHSAQQAPVKDVLPGQLQAIAQPAPAETAPIAQNPQMAPQPQILQASHTPAAQHAAGAAAQAAPQPQNSGPATGTQSSATAIEGAKLLKEVAPTSGSSGGGSAGTGNFGGSVDSRIENARRALRQNGATHVQTAAEGDEAVEAQVAKGLAAAFRQRGGTVTLRLNPEVLGPLKITVRVEDGQVFARFEPSTAEAHDLLTKGEASLKQAVEARGLSVDRIEIARPSASSDQTRNDGAGERRDDRAGDHTGREQHDGRHEPRHKAGSAPNAPAPSATSADAETADADSAAETVSAQGLLRLSVNTVA